MQFPPYPRSNAEIYDFPGHGEYMTCTMVREQTARLLMAFRDLRREVRERIDLVSPADEE